MQQFGNLGGMGMMGQGGGHQHHMARNDMGMMGGGLGMGMGMGPSNGMLAGPGLNSGMGLSAGMGMGMGMGLGAGMAGHMAPYQGGRPDEARHSPSGSKRRRSTRSR
jgi:hypothetical protein